MTIFISTIVMIVHYLFICCRSTLIYDRNFIQVDFNYDIYKNCLNVKLIIYITTKTEKNEVITKYGELHTGTIACQYLIVGLGDNGGGVRITSVLVLSFIFALGLRGKLCNFGGSCGKG